MAVSKKYNDSERMLYASTSRIISDACQVHFHKESADHITLECFNQASFKRHESEREQGTDDVDTERIPDCAVFSYNSISGKLLLCLWVEVKRLHSEDPEGWDSEDAEMDALEAIKSAIPQIREQAHHAFRSYPGPAKYDALLQVGPYWTHFRFSKEDEDHATQKMAQLTGESDNEYAIETLEDDTRPSKRQRKAPEAVPLKTAFNKYFPQVSFCHETIIDFEGHKYNPTS